MAKRGKDVSLTIAQAVGHYLKTTIFSLEIFYVALRKYMSKINISALPATYSNSGAYRTMALNGLSNQVQRWHLVP